VTTDSTWTVVVPFDEAGDPHRRRALDFIVRRYQQQGLPVVVSEPPSAGGWSKGVAVDAGVRSTSTWGLVIADADVIVSVDALDATLGRVGSGAAWAQPHGRVYRLGENATRHLIEGEPYRPGRASRAQGPPGGGIVVLSRDAYDTVGGIDSRFVGWGGDDISFARALDTLVGPGVRLGAPMTHLWHVPMSRRPGGRSSGRASPESEALAGRYYDAAGDPTAMRALVSEHKVASRESR